MAKKSKSSEEKKFEINELLKSGFSKKEIIDRTGYKPYLIDLVRRENRIISPKFAKEVLEDTVENAVKTAVKPFEQLVDEVCSFLIVNAKELKQADLTNDQRVKLFNRGVEMISYIGKEFAAKQNPDEED